MLPAEVLEESSIGPSFRLRGQLELSSQGHLHNGHPGPSDVVHFLHAACQAQLLAQTRQVKIDLLPLSLEEGCTGKQPPLDAASEPPGLQALQRGMKQQELTSPCNVCTPFGKSRFNKCLQTDVCSL